MKNYVEIEFDIKLLTNFIGIVIEEIVEEDDLTSKNISASRPQGVVDNSKAADVYQNIVNAESLQELKDDPEAIRSACFRLDFFDVIV